MYYLINSSVRLGEELRVEANSNALPVPAPMSNIMVASQSVLSDTLETALRSLTSQPFNCIVEANLHLSVGVPENAYIFDFGNTTMANVANVLGYPLITSNAYTSTSTGPNIMNMNQPISPGDNFICNIGLLDKYSIAVNPPNYVADNLCLAVQCRLNIQTGKTWSVVYNAGTQRITISISSDSAFKILWNDLPMYNIAQAMGFDAINMTSYAQTITGNSAPALNTILSDEDIFNVIVNTNTTYTTTTNYNFMASNVSATQFLADIKQNLEATTNMLWNTSISGGGLLTISLAAPNRFFSLLNGNTNMSTLATAMGFPTVDTIYVNTITGSLPVNTTSVLDPNAVFYVIVQDTMAYQFPPNSTNATVFINSLAGLLNTATGKSWSVVVDTVTHLATISILNVDCVAQILFSRPAMATIATALGFDTSANTIYDKSFTGTNPVDYTTVINLTNKFYVNVNVNVQAGAYSYAPHTDSTSTLVANIQNTLTSLTGKFWDITISNLTGRITIALQNSGYQFRLLFGEPAMATIATALGFPTTNTDYDTILSGSSPINYSAVVSLSALFYVDIIQTNPISYSYPSNRTSMVSFISTLQTRLNTITGKSWTVSTNPITNRLTIQLNTANYQFQLQLTNSAMTQVGLGLGFNVLTDIGWVRTIEAPSAINYTFLLNSTDFFYFAVRAVSTEDITLQYSFPVGRPNYNPLVHLKQVETGLQVQTAKNWDILYSNVSNKITINLVEADSNYRILWGNTFASNIALDWGFNPISPVGFVNTSTGANVIDFNRNLVYTDQLLYQVQTKTYYKLNSYAFLTAEASYNATDYINRLPLNLMNSTGDNWTVMVDSQSQKATIAVNTPNRLFNMAFGNPLMVNIAKLLGFPPITTGIFTDSITGTSAVDYSVQLTETDTTALTVKTTNYYFAKPYNYTIDQPNYDSQVFTNNLQSILNTQTGKSWTVSYSSATQKLTITINTTNCQFRMFFSNPSMELIAEAWGYNPVDSSTYFTTITSDTTVNFNITLTGDNVLVYEVRDTTGVLYDSATTNYQWLIDPPFYQPTYFVQYIQNDLNRLIPYTTAFSYNTSTKKATITCPSAFRIFWSNMSNLAQIFGFNMTTSASYITATTSDTTMNLTYPIQLTDYFNIEFLNRQTRYTTSFYNIMGQYYATLLRQRLYDTVAYPWTVVYDSLTAKFTIGLTSLKFRLEWGQTTMANVASIYGFSASTPATYSNQTTSNLVFNPLSNLSTNNTVFVSFQPNETLVGNTLYMEPRVYANANVFCNILQFKLCQSFATYGINFFCNYDGANNKISVANTPDNYQFKFYLGSCPNTATLLGLEQSNISPYAHQVYSDKECYFSGQLSRILVDLRQSVSFTKIKMLNISLGVIYNIADGNNHFYFSKIVGGVATDYLIRIQPASYTGTSLASYLQTQMNVVSTAFTVAYDTTSQRFTWGLTDGNTFILGWDKSKILATMCGFNGYATLPARSITSDFCADLVYPKVVYLTIENIKYSPQIVNNRFMFYITLGNINYDQQYSVNSQINRMIVSLYDENNNLLALNSNWQATLELL